MGITITAFATFDEAVDTDALIRDTGRILTDARIAEDLPLPAGYPDDADEAVGPTEYVRRAWTVSLPESTSDPLEFYHRIDYGWTADELDEIVGLCRNADALLRHLPDGSGDATAEWVRAHILPRWESLRAHVGGVVY